MSERQRRTAGRPREFDPDVAAASALETFWARGFKDVSVPDLEEATGVVRTSLYNTFGNKRGVFDAALDVYLGRLFADIDSRLTNGTGGLDDIHAFLDQLEEWHVSGIPGCFMINSMIEFAEADPEVTSRGVRYLDKLRAAILAALSRVETRGELGDPDAIESAADRLLLQIIGLNTAARSGMDVEQLKTLYRSAHDAVSGLQAS